MRSILFALLLATPALTAAQSPRTVEVRLSSFDFTPNEIHLRAGEPVALHLVNSGRGGHNFSAPQFFAAASGVSGPVRSGAVEVGSHASAEVRLTPARGHYRLRCTHSLHTAFGMTGQIVVE
ncbi:MAG TPA: cupredoxin domain-containing protein [Allosphingosinicella sp.]|nr:cupredoxin domain-containing protein [Allosphingosinicella sp.]